MLDKHSSIFTSKPVKEVGFFWDFKERQNYFKNREFFAFRVLNKYDLVKNFMLSGYKGERFIGESCPFYTCFPERSKAVVTRMATRNPLRRIFSAYKHYKKRGRDSEFRVFLESATGKNAVETSHYFRQLEPYLSFLSRNQLHLILFEDLLSNQASVLREVHSFIGCKDEPIDKIPHANRSPSGQEISDESIISALGTINIASLNADLLKLSQFLERDLFGFWNLNLESAFT